MLTKRFRDPIARAVVTFSLFAVLVAGGAMVASEIYAATYHTEYTYFSDASHTEVVGFRMITCSGSTYKYGQVSPHKEVYQEMCSPNP